MRENFYQMLGIEPDADFDAIRQAINSRIRQIQASLNSSDRDIYRQAEKKMEILILARKTLLNPHKHKEYNLSLRKVEPVKPKEPSPVSKGQFATLILFDATDSMNPLWDKTASIVEEMVRRIAKVGDVQLKCCAYRDYCDGDRIFETSKWSAQAKPLLKFIELVQCDGGGDFPEAVEVALRHAVEENKVTRVILIGDAPPHEEGDYRQQAINLGKKRRPVFAFRVGGEPETAKTFREIAKLSGGRYADLKNYKDLLDMIAITVVHDAAGSKAVEEYTEKYQLSIEIKKFAKSLPSKK